MRKVNSFGSTSNQPSTSPTGTLSAGTRRRSPSIVSNASRSTTGSGSGSNHITFEESTTKTIDDVPKFDRTQFSILVVGSGCMYEKDQLKQRNFKGTRDL